MPTPLPTASSKWAMHASGESGSGGSFEAAAMAGAGGSCTTRAVAFSF